LGDDAAGRESLEGIRLGDASGVYLLAPSDREEDLIPFAYFDREDPRIHAVELFRREDSGARADFDFRKRRWFRG